MLGRWFKRQKGIKFKFIITFLVLVSIPLSFAGVYGTYFSIGILEDITLQHLEYEVSTKVADIEKFLTSVSKDALFISRSATINELLDFDGAGWTKEFEKTRKMLESEFLALSQTHPYYYQIRYIDAKGDEVVRVDFDGKDSYAVPVHRLQYKGDMYYYLKSLNMPRGEVFVSQMDLNVEQGEVELPHKPVVRVGTSVFDSTGRKKGIVIINIYASYVIQQLKAFNVSKGGSTFLANTDGIYLSYIDGKDDENPVNFGFTGSLGLDYSADEVNDILSGRSGTKKTGMSIMSYSPVKLGKSLDTGYWILAMVYPKKTIFASVWQLEVIFVIISMMAAFLALLAGIWMARRFTGPILKLHEGVEWISDGDFHHKLDISTGDEIETLANRFNVMSDNLRESRERMEAWNEELKKEVEHRTRELNIEKNKLANIIMSAVEGIIVTDRYDRIIILNPAAKSMFNVRRDDVLGENVFGIHENMEAARGLIGTRAKASSQVVTTSIGQMAIEISGGIINYEGEKFGARIVIRDVTERQKLLKERMTIERQLFHADKLVSIGELSSGIAHEIGNPLAAIKTVIQAMDVERPFVGEQKKYMERILKEVNRLAVFLRTFSAFANPGVGRSARCRVEDVLQEVLFLIRNEGLKHNIKISDKLENDLPEMAMGSNHLKQVFINLFLNAIQAIGENGDIFVSARNLNDKEVLITLSDTGPGIPEQYLNKIFDPFFTSKPMGTGLGLSIVHRIIKEYNGSLNVKSVVNEGATFEVSLPVERRYEDREGASKPLPAPYMGET